MRLKHLAAAFVALLALAVPASAGPTNSAGLYCQLTVTTVVKVSACPNGIPANTTYIVIANEGAAYRWQDDGTVPTTTVGQPVAAGTATAPISMSYTGPFAALQVVAQSGTTILNISFYK